MLYFYNLIYDNNYVKFTFLVGVWYIMWDSIGKVRENKDDMDLLPAHRQNDPLSQNKSISNAAFINVDFSSSTKGLFSGMKNFLINLHLLSYFSLTIQHISS